MRPYCRYDHEDIPEGIPEHDYPSTYVMDNREYRFRGHLFHRSSFRDHNRRRVPLKDINKDGLYYIIGLPDPVMGKDLVAIFHNEDIWFGIRQEIVAHNNLKVASYEITMKQLRRESEFKAALKAQWG